MANEPSQADHRRYAYFVDQHGRRWGATIELRTGHPVGPMQPAFEHDAPVVPPQAFVKMHPTNPMQVVIDYDLWAASEREAAEAYQRKVREQVLRLGLSGTISDLIQNPPPEIRDIVGPPPETTPIQVIQACKAQNRWVIYGQGTMPEAARRFFSTEPDSTRVERRRRATPSLPEQDPFAEDGQDEPSDEGPVPAGLYTLEMTSPGRWTMPDGETVSGTRDDAEARLREDWPEHASALLAGAGA